MKILFCSSEVFPFSKTGGLADVSGALPIGLEQCGHDVTVCTPFYRCVTKAGINIEHSDERFATAKIGQNVRVIFIKSAKFFDRDGIYGDAARDYADNFERYVFFNESIVEFIKKEQPAFDVVHGHDWHTGILPFMLKREGLADRCPTVLTIHNLAFQGVFPWEKFKSLGIHQDAELRKPFEFYGQMNWLKAGILQSDVVTTVSRQYAKDIQTEEFGCGLDDEIRQRSNHLFGIVNGLDEACWDPTTDGFLARTYHFDNAMSAKRENREKLSETCGLPAQGQIPLLGFVSRLSHQKGVDLLLKSLKDILELNLQIVLLGTGDKHYEDQLAQWESRYPEKLSVQLVFSEELAHQIYAASDFFLMPSTFEPCGLSQMIAMRYGSIPAVFATGGLLDTVVPFHKDPKNATGLMFDKHVSDALLDMIRTALRIYQDIDIRGRLMSNGMKQSFSWDKAAKEYGEVYDCALSA